MSESCLNMNKSCLHTNQLSLSMHESLVFDSGMFWQKLAAVTHDVFFMGLNTECLNMNESCHIYE